MVARNQLTVLFEYANKYTSAEQIDYLNLTILITVLSPNTAHIWSLHIQCSMHVLRAVGDNAFDKNCENSLTMKACSLFQGTVPARTKAC